MMPTDRYERNTPSLAGPAQDGFAITPHDSQLLARVTRSIYVGGAGAIVLVTLGGTQLTFSGLAAGSVLPIRATRVLAAGTTATGLVGLD